MLSSHVGSRRLWLLGVWFSYIFSKFLGTCDTKYKRVYATRREFKATKCSSDDDVLADFFFHCPEGNKEAFQ